MAFIIQPGVQAIFDQIAALHGVRIAFFTPNGSELRVGKSRGNCEYCRKIQGTLGLKSLCEALDQCGRREAADSGQRVAYQCHAGMTEVVLPVRVAGRLLGFVMIGQFRARNTPPPALLAKARHAGIEKTLVEAFHRAPSYSRAQTDDLVGLLQVLVDFIAEHHMIDVQDSIAPLIERMWARPDEHLSLSHAAALAGCDATTLSRRFKRKLGHSFRGVKVQLTLEKADKLFRESPTLRISEVAYQLGFEDPLYFSRFYRRHRGMPPTEAKRRILSEQRKRQGSRPKC